MRQLRRGFGAAGKGLRKAPGGLGRGIASAGRGIAKVPLNVVGLVALLAILVLVGLAAFRAPPKVRGYAEIVATNTGCSVTKSRDLNVLGCGKIGRNVYAIYFDRRVDDSAPVATIAACCSGRISVGPIAERAIAVVFPRRRRRQYPVAATVLVP